MHPLLHSWPIGVSLAVVLISVDPAVAADLHATPAVVVLRGPDAVQQVLVAEAVEGGNPRDISRAVQYEVVPSAVATVDERGVVRPLADGHADLRIRYQGEQIDLPVVVRDVADPSPVSFQRDVIPMLTKASCNSGGCHGKAEGQNGFKLSVFGFDAVADHQAITMESRGRRISPATPEQSLLLLKASARVPHGGGQKIEPSSRHERLLQRWIAEGARFDSDNDASARTVALEIEPAEQILLAGQAQQLRITAIDADGTRRCVTTEAQYESNEPSIADVDASGLVEASDIPGEAAILVRYLDHVAVCRVVLPRPDVEVTRPPENNFIDRLVWDKLQQLGIEPSGEADDAEFLRRIYLDTIGTLPTPSEARHFLLDNTPDKRARLIDRLLERDEYADYWAMRWLSILRADQAKISPNGTVAMQRWLRRQFSENRPFDQMARELLTVQGNTSAEGPGSFYKVLEKPDEVARAISQLFLGVRIECAQCHHHPSERWGQSDYVALAGFFTGVSLKTLPGGEQAVVSRGGADLPHPRTATPVAARALGAEPADFTGVVDRRRVLAEWMIGPENPYFAKAIANRLWAHYFGRGLIEPIDDIRDTNPATNQPLMDALAAHLRDVGFDLRTFTRTLLNSRVYQLSATTNSSNEDDAQNFSHAAFKTLPAEVLLDAICQSAGVPEKFNGWPSGYRAIQVWDNRMPSYFFTIFGRPIRATVCECERGDEPSVAQALHLLNAPEIADKIGHRQGRVRRLASSDLSPGEIVDELYLSTLSRFPTEEEKALMLQAFESSGIDRRAASEDVLWALLNSRQFVFNH